MTLIRPALLACAVLLSGCAPSWPTPDQARDALVVRMERPAERKVEVTRVEAFALENCRAADKGPGVLCDVRMDVSFQLDGEAVRSDESQPVRFVRESGNWVAYPE